MTTGLGADKQARQLKREYWWDGAARLPGRQIAGVLDLCRSWSGWPVIDVSLAPFFLLFALHGRRGPTLTPRRQATLSPALCGITRILFWGHVGSLLRRLRACRTGTYGKSLWRERPCSTSAKQGGAV